MALICRLMLNAASRGFRFLNYRAAFAILFLVAFAPGNARAEITTEQAVDFALKAAATGASFFGVSIPDPAPEILKDLVICGAKGTPAVDCAKASVIKVALKDFPDEVKKLGSCLAGGSSLATCAGDALVKQLPVQAQPMAQCMIAGKNVADCAGQAAIGEIIARVPEAVRPMVECAAKGGSPAQCGAQAVADSIPPGPPGSANDEAKKVAQCIATPGRTAESCAVSFGSGKVDQATKQATQDALNKLKDLKADAAMAIDKQKGTVANIIAIAEGIDKGDYLKILEGAGPELAKIVISVVINALIPPVAPIAGPIIGAMVDLYTETAKEVISVAKTGDLSKLPEIIVKFYFDRLIAPGCALIPESGFKDVACGGLSELVAAMAGFAGDVTSFVLDIAKDILKATGAWDVLDGIYSFFAGIWKDIFGGLEDPKVCGPASAYFAGNYLTCLGAAVGASSATSSASKLNSDCVQSFSRCYDKSGPTDICNALSDAFAKQVSPIEAGLDQGAQAYTKSLGTYLFERREALCDGGVDFRSDFTNKCVEALSKNVPLRVDTCKAKNPNMSSPLGPSWACSKAVRNSYLSSRDEVCNPYFHEKHEAYCWANGCPEPPSGSTCRGGWRLVDDKNPPFSETSTKAKNASYGRTYEWEWVPRLNCPWPEIPNWNDKFDWPIRWPDHRVSDYFPTDPIIRFGEATFGPFINPGWITTVGTAIPGVSMPPSLTIGNCRIIRTLFNPVGQLIVTRPALTAQSSMLRRQISLEPDVSRLVVSLSAVSLVSGGIESCGGTGIASRGSSGSDGSFSPKLPTLTKSGSGVATAVRGSSGSDGSFSPKVPTLTKSGSGGATAVRGSSGSDGVQRNPMDMIPSGDSLSGVSGNKGGIFIGGGSSSKPPCPTCGGTVKVGGPKPTTPPAPAATPKGVDIDYGGSAPVTEKPTWLK